MKNKSFISLIYFSFFLLFVIINIVLLSLWTVNFALFFGFSIGSLISFLLFEINSLSLTWILLKSKKSATLLGGFKFLINMVIVSAIFIAIIYINRGYALKNNITSIAYDKPINIIAFSIGLSIIFLAVILSLFVESFLKRRERSKSGTN